MLLGALLDAGLPLADLRGELAKLSLTGYQLTARAVKRAGIAATQAVVEVQGEPEPRTLADVLRIVDESTLPAEDRDSVASVFHGLAEAEAAVHGETIETVHLHDVGAVDAVVDVVGTVSGLRLLGASALHCSPLPVGEGETTGPHGTLPVPAPATLQLLARAGAPVRSSDGQSGELVTPTGAAIVTTLATFARPQMTVERVGYGAGSRDRLERPNVLRLWLGERISPGPNEMLLVETNIDDMTGETLAYAHQGLMDAGAVDAWFTPIQMKKGRPAVMLSAICSEADEARIAGLMLRETSTLGVRVRRVHRWEAGREMLQFESSLGPAAVKVKRLPGEPPRYAPEFESCRRLAEASGLPLAEVYRRVEAEAAHHLG